MLKATIISALCLLLALASQSQAATPAVTIEICDRGISADKKWPAASAEVSETYQETAFGFFQTPWRYTGTGVREDRGIPFLFRATANVEMPAGKVRLLLRARGPARLRIDDAVVVELPFPKISESGHGTLRTHVLVLGNTRYVAPGDYEKLAEYDSAGGPHRIVLETIVGSIRAKKSLKPEFGETLAAIAPVGSDAFTLLSPALSIPLTDEGWTAYAAERSAAYDHIEAARRLAARSAHEPEIRARHDAARAWVAAHPAPAIPDAPASVANPIDRFLHAKLARAQAAASQEKGLIHFYDSVRPLLADRCFTCHSNKPKGGLRLDSLATAMKGGESGKPAITGWTPPQYFFRRVRTDSCSTGRTSVSSSPSGDSPGCSQPLPSFPAFSVRTCVNVPPARV